MAGNVSVLIVIMLLSPVVGAESVAADSETCSSCTLSEVIGLIREEFKDVKNLIASRQINSIEAPKQALVSALVRE